MRGRVQGKSFVITLLLKERSCQEALKWPIANFWTDIDRRIFLPLLHVEGLQGYMRVLVTMLSYWLCRELQKGIDVAEENGRKLGVSRKVAFIAIAEVTISRIAMAAPYMGKLCFFG